VSRLQQFVQTYFSRSTSHLTQTIDDSFISFLWRSLCDLQEIRLGVLQVAASENGDADEVKTKTVSSRGGKLNRDARRGVQHVFVPLDEAEKSRSMEELVALYGSRLRLAVDPETCWVTMTGGHDRVRTF
jgi:hypothetical protein